MRPLAKELNKISKSYDVVIVGSGYGGSVSAYRLSLAGYKVCVLERGREFLPGDFPNSLFDSVKEAQIHSGLVSSGKNDALIDFRISPDMTVMVASGLGGGSLINAGAAIRPEPEVFEDEAWPEPLRNTSLLEEGYKRANEMLDPDFFDQSDHCTKFQTLSKIGQKMGVNSDPIPLALSFDDKYNKAGKLLNACEGCGDCWIGCNANAKNSLDKNYLALAVELGAEIFTLARVRHVESDENKGWQVHFEDAKSWIGRSRNPKKVKAKRVILAAGALGSTEILLRSREKGLRLSDKLGEKFSGNGDYMGYGYGSKETVNAIGSGSHLRKRKAAKTGPSAVGMIRVKDDETGHEFVLQDGVLLSILAFSLPFLNMSGGQFNEAFKNMIGGDFSKKQKSLQTFYVVSRDGAGGKIVMNKDKIRIDWPDIREHPAYARVHDVLEKVVGQLEGASYHPNMLSDNVIHKNKPISVHPLGGCSMADNVENGVVNYGCEVFDPESGGVHAGLMVVDGSVIPQSLGINPLLTITAISEIAMKLLLEDRAAEEVNIEEDTNLMEQA